jgi:hypothetical protein
MRVMRFLQSMCLSSFRALIGWGDPERRALSSQARLFSEGQEWIVCAFAKGGAPNLRGKPRPTGLELPSAGAERGNYLEVKPEQEGLKGRPARTTASYLAF